MNVYECNGKNVFMQENSILYHADEIILTSAGRLKTCIDYLLDIYDTKIMKMDKFY
jgi:hypothetical protein